jgi:sulfur-oxidizing protein SoxY
MKQTRRHFLSVITKSVGILVAVASLPRVVWASWNANAFGAESLDSAIAESFGSLPIEDSDALTLKAPSIAENGAVVPISVSTDMPVSKISIFVEKNPSPLAASFNIQSRMDADVSVRIRMGETSNLVVLAESNGKLYRTAQEVKVTIGGCGG